MKLTIELEMDDSMAAHLDKMVQDNTDESRIDALLIPRIEGWFTSGELYTAALKAVREQGRQQARQRVEDDAQ